MDPSGEGSDRACAFELVYASLHLGRCFAFPCNETGIVDLDALTEQARSNYLLVRALVGRDFGVPSIIARSVVS